MKKLIFAMPLLFCTLTSTMQEQDTKFLQTSSILKEFYRKHIVTHKHYFQVKEVGLRQPFNVGFNEDYSLAMVNQIELLYVYLDRSSPIPSPYEVCRNYQMDFKGACTSNHYDHQDKLPKVHTSFLSTDEVEHINTSYGLAIPLQPLYTAQGRAGKLLVPDTKFNFCTVTLYDVSTACAVKEHCERDMSQSQIRLLSAIETANNKFKLLALSREEQDIFDQFPDALKGIVRSNVVAIR
jgi:hypothetical protein